MSVSDSELIFTCFHRIAILHFSLTGLGSFLTHRHTHTHTRVSHVTCPLKEAFGDFPSFGASTGWFRPAQTSHGPSMFIPLPRYGMFVGPKDPSLSNLGSD